MKKILFVLPFIALLGACLDPEAPLPGPSTESKTVKLTKANCGLTNSDSTEAFETSLDIEGKEEKYVFEIGPNCYAHATYEEFLIKKNGYIKSKSTFKVDRLIIDYFSGKGVNFEVLDANGSLVSSHESTVQTEYPGDSDKGAVLEYAIDGNSWTIQNKTEYKPAFYSITVVFTI